MSPPFPKANQDILNVFLNRAASEDTFAKVRNFLDQTRSSDPQWKGMRFRLFTELFTWVGEDSERAGHLHKQIREILFTQDFEHPEMIA